MTRDTCRVANTAWDRVGLPYHVFCLHTIWNRAEVAASLGPGATYITILREPVQLFESLWSYAGLASYYNMDLETFATSPKEGRLATRAFRYFRCSVSNIYVILTH